MNVTEALKHSEPRDFKEKDLTEMEPEDIAREGVFLGFQYPVEVPGVSNFGSEGPIFENMRLDFNLQSRIEAHAKDNGRPFFGWIDLSEMFADTSNSIPFSSHVCR